MLLTCSLSAIPTTGPSPIRSTRHTNIKASFETDRACNDECTISECLADRPDSFDSVPTKYLIYKPRSPTLALLAHNSSFGDPTFEVLDPSVRILGWLIDFPFAYSDHQIIPLYTPGMCYVAMQNVRLLDREKRTWACNAVQEGRKECSFHLLLADLRKSSGCFFPDPQI